MTIAPATGDSLALEVISCLMGLERQWHIDRGGIDHAAAIDTHIGGLLGRFAVAATS